jgi:Mannosyltransferase putative
MNGICTLANDHVFDQAIALLNSIEAVMGSEFPVCIIPYDDRCDRLLQAIQSRPQVQIYPDQSVLQYWEHQAMQIWDAHPTAKQRWTDCTSDPYYRLAMHRRFAAFSGPFDRFIYMDADTLLLNDITPVLDQLDQHDWVVYDFQHYDPTHIYDCSSAKLLEVFSPTQLDREIFCAGFYAAKRGIFSQEQLDICLADLQAGEAEILYCMAPDQTILNYWVMRSQLSVYNFALNLPAEKTTGCCVTSGHFQQQGDRLFDRGNPLTYLHYIGLSSSLFQRLCDGENLDFPYRDLFLHYRYLHDPQNRPEFVGKLRPYNQRSLTERLLTKLGLPR